jgi:C1A family cysteine protease
MSNDLTSFIFGRLDTDILTINQLYDQDTNVFQNIANQSCAITNETLQKIIFTYGPVVGTIDNKPWYSGMNGQPIWYSSTKNYIGPSKYTKSADANHTIIITGWGYTQKSKPYWIIKNSWGDKWNYNGYAAVEFSSLPCKMFNSIAYIKSTDIDTYISKYSISSQYQKYKNQSDQLKINSNTFLTLPDNIVLKPAAVISRQNFGGFVPSTKSTSSHDDVIKITADRTQLKQIPAKYKNNNSPIVFCWANKNNPLKQSIVSKVKNQGKCNSCWIFDCLDILSSSIALHIASHKVIDFSVQKFITVMNNNVCQSGGSLETFNTMLKTHKIVLHDPFCKYLNEKACKSETNCKTKIGCKLNDSNSVDTNETDIENNPFINLGGSNYQSAKSVKKFTPASIIFLIFMIIFFIILFAQLFQNSPKIIKILDKYVLTGIIICFIVSTILFTSLYTKSI